jgi:hypothetical protein
MPWGMAFAEYSVEDLSMATLTHNLVPNSPETNADRDPQEIYDDNIGEYTTGQAVESNDQGEHKMSGRFPRDFFKYSQDFHDRENGAPGIDEDFGTNSGGGGREAIIPAPMPEGDGVLETSFDREIREEIMDLFTNDSELDASDVTVRVADGIVTLSGNVDEARMRKALEESAATVPGVDEVQNCLIINPTLF